MPYHFKINCQVIKIGTQSDMASMEIWLIWCIRILWQVFCMQSWPVKKTKNVITGCYKWHTTV